jgi:hypothetical protein
VIISTGIFYDSLSGLVLPDDTRRWNWHEIECAWRQQGGRGLSLPPVHAWSLSIHWWNVAINASSAISLRIWTTASRGSSVVWNSVSWNILLTCPKRKSRSALGPGSKVDLVRSSGCLVQILFQSLCDVWPDIVSMYHQFSSLSCVRKGASLWKNMIIISGVSLWGEHLGTPIGSRIQISADSDTCSGKIDLGFSVAGRKSKSHVGWFLWRTRR